MNEVSSVSDFTSPTPSLSTNLLKQQSAFILGKTVRLSIVSDTCFRIEVSPNNKSLFEDKPTTVIARRFSQVLPPLITAIRSSLEPTIEITTRRLKITLTLSSNSTKNPLGVGSLLSVDLLSPTNNDPLKTTSSRKLFPISNSKTAPSLSFLQQQQQQNNIIDSSGALELLRAFEQTEDAYSSQNNLLGMIEIGNNEFEQGILSRSGFVLLNDSKSNILSENPSTHLLESIERAQEHGYLDLYFLGFGDEFNLALNDLVTLCGDVPFPPKYAFGLWWNCSSLNSLPQDFSDFRTNCGIEPSIVVIGPAELPRSNRTSEKIAKIPSKVLLTMIIPPNNTQEKQKQQQQQQQKQQQQHPAASLRPGDVGYLEVASISKVIIGTKSLQLIPLNFNDAKMALGYKKYVLGGLTEKGASGFWIETAPTASTNDGSLTLTNNDLRVLDVHRTRDGIICSNWCGIGTHRSASVVRINLPSNWESLRSLPEITCCAGNSGCFYLLSNIGGSFNGAGDKELLIRWFQFASLSSIFYLNSINEFDERRPWMYDSETFRICKQSITFRKTLIPYLYSMAYRSRKQTTPFITPMYFIYPTIHNAYHCPHQYFLGSELLISPFVLPSDLSTRLSRQVVWFPPGLWYNLFDGTSFQGNSWQSFYGELDDIPIFAKSGAIIPLFSETCTSIDSNELDIIVFPGENSVFELCDEGACLCTISLHRGFQDRISLLSIEQKPLAISRTFNIIFRSISCPTSFVIECNGNEITNNVSKLSYNQETHTAFIGPITSPNGQCSIGIKIEGAISIDTNILEAERIDNTLHKMLLCFSAESGLRQRIESELKAALSQARSTGVSISQTMMNALSTGNAQELCKSQIRALAELLCSCGCVAFDSGLNNSRRRHCIAWNNTDIPEMIMEIPIVIIQNTKISTTTTNEESSMNTSSNNINSCSDMNDLNGKVCFKIPMEGFSVEADTNQKLPLFFDYGTLCRIRIGPFEGDDNVNTNTTSNPTETNGNQENVQNEIDVEIELMRKAIDIADIRNKEPRIFRVGTSGLLLQQQSPQSLQQNQTQQSQTEEEKPGEDEQRSQQEFKNQERQQGCIVS